jgi:UDP-glucose 4-epimerase|tara:strand:- start:116 stop:457 length:342 start_codon:yes stop_codon:yes gene_type:complete
LATQTCRLKSLNRGAEVILEPGTIATRQKTNLRQDIGLAKHGSVLNMQVEEVLSRLEKHEAECNLRYRRIEERLGDQKELIAKNSEALSKLDLKIWGIAVLIILAPIAANFWG